MDLVGYILAIVIGLLLSLLGGGGSILTVPVLVYVFKIDAGLATAYSLLIVGSTSAMASINYLRKGLASPKTAMFFLFPSLVMVFITRKFLMPLLPKEIVRFEDFILTKNILIMITFAFLMVLASRSMIRKRQEINQHNINTSNRDKNNIKNKMLHMVCAVVKRGTPYIENYVSPYQKNVA